MAEFKSFEDLGNIFHSGMQNLGSKEYQYRARSGHEANFDKALAVAGKEFVAYFKAKLDDGADFAVLSEATIDDRIKHGIDSDKPLNAEGYLRDALAFEVTGSHTLQVGVINEMHPRPDGEENENLISMEDLVEQNETGYTTAATSRMPSRLVPPRPIFTAPDFNDVAEIIAIDFAEAVLRNKGQFTHAKFSKDGRS